MQGSDESAAGELLPRVISWNLTSACNLRCRHCYLNACAARPDELATEEALRILSEIAQVDRTALLILSGGEPLLRRDLDVLVARAAELGLTPVLGTNGTLLTPSRARELARAGLAGVGISVDSMTSGPHDRFRGVDGSWQGAAEGIRVAHEAGLEVQVQMTLTREGLEDLSAMTEMTRQSGARFLAVFFLVCTGRGQSLVDLTPEGYEGAIGQLGRLFLDGAAVRPRCAPTFRRWLAQNEGSSPALSTDVASCMAGKAYCRITPEGTVTPCPYMPLAAGSLRERSFGEIWREAPVFHTLRRPTLQGRCGRCEFQQVCGGCRARAYASTGDPCAEDPWCVHVPRGADAVAPTAVPLVWTREAESRLAGAPSFARRFVRAAVEDFARRTGATLVTPSLMQETRRAMRAGGSVATTGGRCPPRHES